MIRALPLSLAVAAVALPIFAAQVLPKQDTRSTKSLDARVWCLHEDPAGHLWLGTNGAGVYRFDGERLEHFFTEEGLVGAQVRDIAHDAKGRVLVATTTGVSRFDGERFEALEFLPSDDWKLAADDVWMAYMNGGPLRYDGERVHRLTLPETPRAAEHRRRLPNVGFSLSDVYTAFRDRRGHVWFGTTGVGLCRFDGERLAWMYEERLTNTPGGGAFGIRSIYEDRAGHYWIANTRQRFSFERASKLEGERHELEFARRPGLPDSSEDEGEGFTYVHEFDEDVEGRLWMAAGSDGVWCFDGEEVKRFETPGYVFSVLCDCGGRVLAGTVEDGLYALEGDAFAEFQPWERVR